jgi:Na+/H+ antiporter NhaC
MPAHRDTSFQSVGCASHFNGENHMKWYAIMMIGVVFGFALIGLGNNYTSAQQSKERESCNYLKAEAIKAKLQIPECNPK